MAESREKSEQLSPKLLPLVRDLARELYDRFVMGGMIAKILHESREAGRQDALEEAAKVMCFHCEEGDVPRENNPVLTANGKPLWHFHEGGLKTICQAAAIRALKEKRE